MTIVFLTFEDVPQIHHGQIDLYGGEPTIRDEALLKSAIAQASSMFGGQWLHDFPQGMAAAYLFHLVSNHGFVDGNKRTGFATALAFLELNQFRLDASEQDALEMVLAVAKGEMPKAAVVEFFSKYARPQRR